jgi:hypothetical protein
VQHLEIRDDYRALRRLARDWLDRTEQMVGYFEDYMDPKEAALPERPRCPRRERRRASAAVG